MLRGGLALIFVTGIGGAAAGCFTDIPGLTTGEASSTSTAGETTGATTGTTTTGATTEGSSATTSEAPPSACPDVDALVACYEFEAMNGLLLNSRPSGFNGLLVGVAAAEGRHGQGGLFSATSSAYVQHDADTFQVLLEAFTIAAWIRPGAGNTGTPRGVLDKDGFFTLGVVEADGGGYTVHCQIAGAGVKATVSAAVDSWIHVACSYRKAVGLTVVVNGQVGEMSAADAQVGDDPMFVGNDGPMTAPETAFRGVIDDVQLWSVDLSVAEICEAAGLPC